MGGFDTDGDDLDSQLMDWRNFRAKLVRSEQQKQADQCEVAIEKQEAFEPGEELWLHELAEPEPGCLLIANPSKFQTSQNYFRHAVILLAEHGEEGSVGFIHNRPTPWVVGDIAPSLSVFARCPVYFGGPVGDGLQFVHRIPGIPRSVPLMDGVFLGGDIEAAAEAVRSRTASLSDVRFFYKYCSWSPGQLGKELAASMIGSGSSEREPVWFQAACSSAVLFYPRGTAYVRTHTDSSEWRAMLQLMPARFAARYPEIQQTHRDAFPAGAMPSAWMHILREDADADEDEDEDEDEDAEEQRVQGSAAASVEHGLALIEALAMEAAGGDAHAGRRVSVGGVGAGFDHHHHHHQQQQQQQHQHRVAAELDAMAASVRRRAEERLKARATEEGEEGSGARLLLALSDVVIGGLGFRAETQEDLSPASFLISEVLKRRKGSPLLLAIVFQALARRLGIRLSLVALEGQEALRLDAGLHPDSSAASEESRPRNPLGRRVAQAWPLKRVGLQEGRYFVGLGRSQPLAAAAAPQLESQEPAKKEFLVDMSRQGKVVSQASALARYLQRAQAGLPQAEHADPASVLLQPAPTLKTLARVLHQMISMFSSGPYTNSLHAYKYREILETLEEAAARLRIDQAA